MATASAQSSPKGKELRRTISPLGHFSYKRDTKNFRRTWSNVSRSTHIKWAFQIGSQQPLILWFWSRTYTYNTLYTHLQFSSQAQRTNITGIAMSEPESSDKESSLLTGVNTPTDISAWILSRLLFFVHCFSLNPGGSEDDLSLSVPESSEYCWNFLKEVNCAGFCCFNSNESWSISYAKMQN